MSQPCVRTFCLRCRQRDCDRPHIIKVGVFVVVSAKWLEYIPCRIFAPLPSQERSPSNLARNTATTLPIVEPLKAAATGGLDSESSQQCLVATLLQHLAFRLCSIWILYANAQISGVKNFL
ncbi:hypothetical protein WM29_14180 [Burkholderia ubonensis]|nr:hypothetical protein WM29_14180 [Burkholderia ubonensis]